MDPKATLIDLLESIACGDWEQAADAVDTLHAWRRKGGHMPEAIHKALDALRFADDEVKP